VLTQLTYLLTQKLSPTRGSNILDLVFSNEVSMVEDLKVLEHFSTSDHNMIEFQFVLRTGSCDALVYKYDFNKGDYNAITSVLNEINWDTVFDSKGTLECYEYFNDKINELIGRYIPQKKRKTKQKCLWLNRRVKQAIRKRNNLFCSDTSCRTRYCQPLVLCQFWRSLKWPDGGGSGGGFITFPRYCLQRYR